MLNFRVFKCIGFDALEGLRLDLLVTLRVLDELEA